MTVAICSCCHCVLPRFWFPRKRLHLTIVTVELRKKNTHFLLECSATWSFFLCNPAQILDMVSQYFGAADRDLIIKNQGTIYLQQFLDHPCRHHTLCCTLCFWRFLFRSRCGDKSRAARASSFHFGIDSRQFENSCRIRYRRSHAWGLAFCWISSGSKHAMF